MRVLKNFFYNSFYQLLMVILPLITAPYVARVLGARAAGTYSYTYSIAYYFVLFAMLGLNYYGNRKIAEVRDNREELNQAFSSIYIMQFVVSIIMIVLFLGYALLVAKRYHTILMIQAIYVASAMFDINWLFMGLEQFRVITIRNSTVKILTVILILICVKHTGDLWLYTVILAGGTLISQLIIWPFAKNYVSFVHVSLSDVVEHIKPNLILLVPSLATSIYRILDKVMIGYMSSVTQVAYYDYADKLIMVSLGFSSALSAVTMPKVVNMLSKKKTSDVDLFTSRVLEIAMCIVCATSFGLASVSSVFIPIFYGSEFVQSTAVLEGLSIAMFFAAWSNIIRTQYLIPQKKDTIYVVAVCLGALVNVLINLRLLSLYGAMGAVLGTISAEAVVAVYQTWMIRRTFNILSNLLRSIPYFIIGTLMFIAVRIVLGLFGNNVRSLISAICIGGIVFVSLVLVYWKLSNSYFWTQLNSFIGKHFSHLNSN